jgi:hypothetical protein
MDYIENCGKFRLEGFWVDKCTNKDNKKQVRNGLFLLLNMRFLPKFIDKTVFLLYGGAFARTFFNLIVRRYS